MSKIHIHCEDCIKGLSSRLEAGSVDLIVTSPPYNLGIDYSTYNDSISRNAYLQWMTDVSYACHRVMSKDASLFINLGSKPTDPTVAFDVLAVLLRTFKLQNTFHWVKSVSVEDKQGVIKSHGHFKPINSPRFVNDCHEYIFHLTKTGKVALDRLAVGVPYEDPSNIERWKGDEPIRCRGNVWYIPYETITSRSKDRPHPATFPVALPRMCMQLHGKDSIRLACDPFVGLGSSALAAQELGIEFYGFDVDPGYISEACRSLGVCDNESLSSLAVPQF